MYQNIYYESRKNRVHIWDDKKGYYCISYKRYAYVKSRVGTYVSLYGDKLKKVFKFDIDTPNLFESDVLPETRVLVDQYADSEELSANHKIMIIDIEVEVTEGFPNPTEADNRITSIAVYNSDDDTYYAFVLDEKKKLTLQSKGNCIIESFEDEYSLLQRFFVKYLEFKPTIITGWNIDVFDMPYLYNRACRFLVVILLICYHQFKKFNGINTVRDICLVGLVVWITFYYINYSLIRSYLLIDWMLLLNMS